MELLIVIQLIRQKYPKINSKKYTKTYKNKKFNQF